MNDHVDICCVFAIFAATMVLVPGEWMHTLLVAGGWTLLLLYVHGRRGDRR